MADYKLTNDELVEVLEEEKLLEMSLKERKKKQK
jgi:hypothetical protein